MDIFCPGCMAGLNGNLIRVPKCESDPQELSLVCHMGYAQGHVMVIHRMVGEFCVVFVIVLDPCVC